MHTKNTEIIWILKYSWIIIIPTVWKVTGVWVRIWTHDCKQYFLSNLYGCGDHEAGADLDFILIHEQNNLLLSARVCRGLCKMFWRFEVRNTKLRWNLFPYEILWSFNNPANYPLNTKYLILKQCRSCLTEWEVASSPCTADISWLSSIAVLMTILGCNQMQRDCETLVQCISLQSHLDYILKSTL